MEISSGVLLGIVFTIIAGLIGVIYNNLDKKIVEQGVRQNNLSDSVNELNAKQTEHENKFVTDTRTREIVREEIQPLREDVHSVRASIESIQKGVNDLVLEFRVFSAVEKARRKRDTEDED